MKVGDYVRTKYGITQFKEYETTYGEKLLCMPVKDGSQGIFANIEDVVKSSPNIIDLIEVGDYVNNEKIVDIGCLTNGPEEGTKVIDYYIAPNTVYYFKNEEIKSIVTKEQFSCMEYKIGE